MGVTGRYVDPHEEHRRRTAELTIRHRPSNVVELHPCSEAEAGVATGDIDARPDVRHPVGLMRAKPPGFVTFLSRSALVAKVG